MIRKILNLLSTKTSGLLGTWPLIRIDENTAAVRHLLEGVLLHEYLQKNLFDNEKYVGTKRLTHYHRSVYTQNGEDGIIAEIFNRIGTTNKYFVEFGVHGVKNNSTFLLVEGWRGLWLGGASIAKTVVGNAFAQQLTAGSLVFQETWITKDNIDELLSRPGVPDSPDLLSIDIDGNDYWMWKAIHTIQPRVVIIEYNAVFPPPTHWVMAYRKDHQWDQSSYFGASLESLVALGKDKGYSLVGCDFAGCNAFFVRSDINLEPFESNTSAAHHYEPPRYFLKSAMGHVQGFGPFENH